MNPGTTELRLPFLRCSLGFTHILDLIRCGTPASHSGATAQPDEDFSKLQVSSSLQVCLDSKRHDWWHPACKLIGRAGVDKSGYEVICCQCLEFLSNAPLWVIVISCYIQLVLLVVISNFAMANFLGSVESFGEPHGQPTMFSAGSIRQLAKNKKCWSLATGVPHANQLIVGLQYQPASNGWH